MSKLGFIERALDNTNYTYSTMLMQMDWYKQVLGTEVIVTRIKESNSYRKVFGTIAKSTLPDDQEAEKFNYTVLISMNDMKKLYQKEIDQLQFFDNQDVIKLGDLLTFSRRNQEYKWQVVDVLTFSETADVLHQYTISGLTEVNALTSKKRV